MRAFIDGIKRLFGFHDSFGLRYTPEHLAEIRDEIITYPLAKQAEYVDAICKGYVDTAMDKIYCPMIEYTPGMQLNTTAIGNTAYIALHSRDGKQRVLAKIFLLQLYNDEMNA